jgi:hypothetical protein
MSRFYAKCCCGAEIKVSALGVNEFKADAWWNLHAMCPKAVPPNHSPRQKSKPSTHEPSA